jgi:hypothetical protein
MSTATAASIQFGMATPIQTLFIVEDAMNLLPEVAVPRAQKMLGTLDAIEAKLASDLVLDQLQAEQIGNLKLRSADHGKTVTDLLEREYVRWAKRLADTLGCPLYPFSDRFSRSAGGVSNGRVTS